MNINERISQIIRECPSVTVTEIKNILSSEGYNSKDISLVEWVIL